MLLLEKENLGLVNERVASKVNEEKLIVDVAHLAKENELLRKQIQDLKQTPQGDSIANESIRVLSYLAKHEEASTSAIAQALKYEIEAVKFFLHELRSSNMVIDSFSIDGYGVGFDAWSLEQEGRRFLIKNKMLA